MSGRPVVAILSPPFALNGEAIGQSIDERVGNTLGEAGEEVQACRQSLGYLVNSHGVGEKRTAH